MLWIFENAIFTIFANFWAAKSTKLFSGKVRQSIQNCLNQNLVIGSFLENGFGASLSSKTSVVSVWKRHFTIFLKCLSDQVETIFWQSEAKCSNLFKSKFGHRKLPRIWFWYYLEFKNECSERLKKAFFQFFAKFWMMKLKRFSGKVRESVENFLNQILAMVNFLENGFEATLTSKAIVLSVWKVHFSVFFRFFSGEIETIFWESEAMRSKLFK